MIRILFILGILSLSIPGVGIFASLLYLYKSKRLKIKEEKLIYLFISLSLGILAFSVNIDNIYNPGGDIYRFFLETKKLSVYSLTELFTIAKTRYNSIFYIIIFCINNFNLPKNLLSFLLVFIGYLSFFYCLIEVRQKQNKNYNKIVALIIIISFYFNSVYTVFSISKSFCSMLLTNLGILKISNRKKIGMTYLVVGILFHNIGIVIVLLFIVSLFLRKRVKRFELFILIAIFNKKIIEVSVIALTKLGLVSNYAKLLINEYLYGKWSNIFYGNGIYGLIHIWRAICILTVTIYFFKKSKKSNDMFDNYLNVYLLFGIIFFQYPFVLVRMILLNSYIFLIYIYKYFLSKKKIKKKDKLVLLIGLIFSFDAFTFMEYGFNIGIGFPWVIFESSFSLLSNYIFKIN